MKSQLAVLLVVLCTHLAVQAQDGSTDVAPPEEMGDADSLDGLDQSKAPTATVPEYHDVTTDTAAVKKTKKSAKKRKAYHEPESSVVGNDPDVQRENRYHEIYQKFNAEPTAVEAWDKAVGDRKAEVYRVQKGDTLWDISSTLFADTQFWPKIWALNKDGILNPHQISPNMNIQFFPGSMNDVPTIGLAANDQVKGEESMVDAAEASHVSSDVVVPKGRKHTPLLKALPNSLPRYRNVIVDRPPTQMQMDLPKNRFPRATEYLTFYVNDEPIKGVGTVTETESVLGSAGEFQYLYVHLDEGNVKNYTVQKNIDVVLDPMQRGRKGYMVEVQGELEVLEVVNPTKNIYRARVKKNLQLMEVGSLLIPGQLPVIQPQATAVTTGVAARIMGGSFWGNRKLFGSDGIVFLDAGSSKGFQEGQTLNIYADQSLRNGRTDAMINDRVIGTVKVVRVTANFSTAYVLTSSLDIVTGDSVGQPRTQASNGSEKSSRVESSPSEADFDLDLDKSPTPPPSEPDAGSSEEDFQL